MSKVITDRSMDGCSLIEAERYRQLLCGNECDEDVKEKHLCFTAAVLCMSIQPVQKFDIAEFTGSDFEESLKAIPVKHEGDIERLIIAGALIAAEIDKIFRAEVVAKM